MKKGPIHPHNLVMYTKLEVHQDQTGNTIDVPGILYDGLVLKKLAEYFTQMSIGHSLPWMNKVREAVRLFLQYSLVNVPQRGFGSPVGADKSMALIETAIEPHEHFRSFSSALQKGTFNPTTRIDPSSLCWRAAGNKKLNRVVNALTEFFEWAVRHQDDGDHDAGSPFNPHREGNVHDRLMAAAAYEHRRSKALLGHMWSPMFKAGSLHELNRTKEIVVASVEPPSFPDAIFDRLLLHGYFVNGHYNWRDILITLLLDGAGFRESEPLHLYIEDVCEDPVVPGSALVRIYHPVEGAAPSGWKDATGHRIVGNRRDYLSQRFGLKPRTEILGKGRAGWKGGTHEDPKKLYKQAYWFKPEYGILFWKLWRRYLYQVQRVPRSHPYAFVNLQRNPGAPYQIGRFQEAHKAAVRRAGLIPDDAGSLKELGLTPHGHRHAYGQRLKRGGLDMKMIKYFMHHSAIESQDVYTLPTTGEIRAALDAASGRMSDHAIDTRKFDDPLEHD